MQPSDSNRAELFENIMRFYAQSFKMTLVDYVYYNELVRKQKETQNLPLQNEQAIADQNMLAQFESWGRCVCGILNSENIQIKNLLQSILGVLWKYMLEGPEFKWLRDHVKPSYDKFEVRKGKTEATKVFKPCTQSMISETSQTSFQCVVDLFKTYSNAYKWSFEYERYVEYAIAKETNSFDTIQNMIAFVTSPEKKHKSWVDKFYTFKTVKAKNTDKEKERLKKKMESGMYDPNSGKSKRSSRSISGYDQVYKKCQSLFSGASHITFKNSLPQQLQNINLSAVLVKNIVYERLMDLWMIYIIQKYCSKYTSAEQFIKKYEFPQAEFVHNKTRNTPDNINRLFMERLGYVLFKNKADYDHKLTEFSRLFKIDNEPIETDYLMSRLQTKKEAHEVIFDWFAKAPQMRFKYIWHYITEKKLCKSQKTSFYDSKPQKEILITSDIIQTDELTAGKLYQLASYAPEFLCLYCMMASSQDETKPENGWSPKMNNYKLYTWAKSKGKRFPEMTEIVTSRENIKLLKRMITICNYLVRTVISEKAGKSKNLNTIWDLMDENVSAGLRNELFTLFFEQIAPPDHYVSLSKHENEKVLIKKV